MKTRHEAIHALLTVILVTARLLAQESSRPDAPAFHIPRTATAIPVNCSDTSSFWKDVARITLSTSSLGKREAAADEPIAILFNIAESEKPITSLPPVIRNKVASYQAHYAFKWDSSSLYGYVEIKDPDINSNHPSVSEKAFRASPTDAASNDLFYSTVVVEVGAPSWQGWTTDMHVHVRPPKARALKAMMYGRTNNEENFRPLSGEAVACPIQGGWVAKFSLVWLPYTDWHPDVRVSADLRLLVPVPHAHEGYVVAAIVPVVLTDKK